MKTIFVKSIHNPNGTAVVNERVTVDLKFSEFQVTLDKGCSVQIGSLTLRAKTGQIKEYLYATVDNITYSADGVPADGQDIHIVQTEL
jgi:hypothetical protein